jgi:hypothetical protein
VEGSCEYGIEPSGSIKCWEVLLLHSEFGIGISEYIFFTVI